MASNKKTPADIIEEKRLEKSNDELDLILSEENSLGEVYDEIHSLEVDQYFKEKTSISGLALIELFFLRTEQEAEAARNDKSKIYEDTNPAPGPEKISRMKDTIREWVRSWVISGDLLILKGDINQDFNSCYFPSEKVFRCVGNYEVLVALRTARFVLDEKLKEWVESIAESEQAKPEPGPEPTQIDPEAFVKSLMFCYSDPDVFIAEAGKRPTPFTLQSIGFHKPEGTIAQEFISILNNPIGPEYELGASHSYLSSGGRNIGDVSSSGTYESEYDEDLSDQISSGISEVPQKTENKSYRAKQRRRDEINKKLCQFIEKEFGITLGDEFKLYEIIPGARAGMCRFKFQNRKITPINTESYSKMTKDQILKKIKILSNLDDEESSDEYMGLITYAKNQGIPKDEIERYINPISLEK